MQVSYSRIDTFKQCPYKYKLIYIDKLETKFNLDPTNALVLGTALHTGIEKNVLEAIKGYYSNYPSVTPLMVNEAIKLEIMIEKAKAILPKGEYELCLDDEDYIGYMDLLVPVYQTNINHARYDENGNVIDNDGYEVSQDIIGYDLYDFKYSNNVDNYLNSRQLHLYKYYFEKLNPGKKIRNLNYVIVPKVKLKQDEYESIEEYRERLIKECEAQNIKIVPIEYNIQKVIDFLTDSKHCIECQDFNKKPNKFCFFCDFKKYCESNGKLDSNIVYPEKIKESEEK